MTAEVGKELRKAEEISYFQFGGSSNIQLSAELNTYYKMGQQIGVAQHK